jgi:hypothetical protein
VHSDSPEPEAWAKRALSLRQWQEIQAMLLPEVRPGSSHFSTSGLSSMNRMEMRWRRFVSNKQRKMAFFIRIFINELKMLWF